MSDEQEEKREFETALGHCPQQHSRLLKARLWLTIAAAGFLIALSFTQAMATTIIRPEGATHLPAASQKLLHRP